MSEPLWKRAGRFAACLAALGVTLVVGLVALKLERRRLKREGVDE